MYTEKKLRSKGYVYLYRLIGKEGYFSLFKAKWYLINGNKSQKNISLNLVNESFNVDENGMHYKGTRQLDKNGNFLKADIVKPLDSEELDISLELCTKGFDYSTGEAFDRTKARVNYTFKDDTVEIKDVKDETFFEQQTEAKQAKVRKIVFESKKDLPQ